MVSRKLPPLSLTPDTPSPPSGLGSRDKTPSDYDSHPSTSREASPFSVDDKPPSREQYDSSQISSSPSISEHLSHEGSPVLTHSPSEPPTSPVPEETVSSLQLKDTTLLKDEPSGPNSYTPFSNEQDLTATTEVIHTELENASQADSTVSDELKSKIGSVEALIPPPEFANEFHTETIDPPPTNNTFEITQENKKLNKLTQENAAISSNKDEESYPEDFEPDDEQSEREKSLEAKSDVSLPVSESNGGDSEEETNFQPGQRVLVGGVMEGVVRFVGKTHFAPGIWIGIEFNEPCGRNDGSIGSQRYFDCRQHHGVFAPPRKLTIIEEFYDDDKGPQGSEHQSSISEELESVLSENMSEYLEDKPFENDEDQEIVYTENFEPELDNQNVDQSLEHSPTPLDNSLISQNTEKSTDIIDDSSVQSEQQAPAEQEQVVGKKPDSLPSAPEVLAQQLQHATPTPAPPPEFAEGASREGSTEPPTVSEHTKLERKPEKLSDELAQELMNEAFETMHQIWASKRNAESEQTKSTVDVVQVPKDKEVSLTLDHKADRITDQLLTLLLQSESNLMRNIHLSKKAMSAETPPEPSSPLKRSKPQLQISVPGLKEYSPPPLSPPSPYRIPPVVMPADHTPPCHLSGGKSQLEAQPGPSKLERVSSTESIVQLLDTVKVTTAQCMVPSERQFVNQMVQEAWKFAQEIGFTKLHSQVVHCPEQILSMFKDVRELSPEEEHCNRAYIQLVFDLTLEALKQLHPISPPKAVWQQNCIVRPPLGNRGADTPSLELVQKRVYASLIRGQLPAQLPAVKFLHGKKRPGGKEVDFVDGVLIKELRFEEPSWIDYHEDETTVKMRTADSILESLVSETVQIMCDIEQKRKKRQAN